MGLNGSDLARMGPEAQRQILNQIRAEAAVRETKYHNQEEARGPLKFDSRKEARRYDELMLLLKSGAIRNLRLQAQYTLQESFLTPEGERIRAIRYVADFAYERAAEPDRYGTVIWLPIVEDVKSPATKTQKYEIKKKLLRERFGIAITEV